MNEAITAGLIFCFGKSFHCSLALGKKNIITFVLMDPQLQTVCAKMMRRFQQLILEVLSRQHQWQGKLQIQFTD